jgi:two-component system, sensor histidine kinase
VSVSGASSGWILPEPALVQPGPPGPPGPSAAEGPLRILMLDDNPGDVRLVRRLLSGGRLGDFRLASAGRLADGLALLRKDGADLVLLDLSLPDGGQHELEPLARIQAQAPSTPVLLLTGRDDEELAVRALREGAQDYLVKSRVNSTLLIRSIRYATERVRYEQELVRLNGKLEQQASALLETDRRKDEFLAMLAHELRNPLAAISNATHVLDHVGSGDGQVVRLCGVIGHQVRHLSRIVDDLLDVSRVLRGQVTLRPERIDLGVVLRNALLSSRPAAEARGHEVAVELPPEPCWVQADATRLEQVVSNLLHNAAKFTPPGGRIRLTLEAQEGAARIRVEDTGKGIPPAMLDRIFDVFTQIDPAFDRSQEGLGIGLTLVKSLVELHGGTVAAKSGGPGRGSEFLVGLPLVAEAAAEAPSQAAPEPAPEEVPVRVLVVEDNVATGETLCELLALWGHEVRMAPDGPSALVQAAELEPDVVLLDLGLPGMDGYEVARRLRRAKGKALRIVALTGYGQDEDRQRTREAGFDEHLTKPVFPEVLKSALAAVPAGGRGAARD